MTIPNRSPRRHAGGAGTTTAAARAAELLGWLERRSTRKHRDGLARYGIVTAKAHGVPVGDLQRQAKALGRDHALALAAKLARSEAPTPRWIGKDALRDLHRPMVRKRVAAKDRARTRRVARQLRDPREFLG